MQEANCISTCLVFLWRLERAPILADSLIMVPNDSSKVWWFLNIENVSQTFLVQFKFRSCFGQSRWWSLEKWKYLYVSPVWEEEHGILCQKEGINPHNGFCPKGWCFASSFPPPSPSPNFLFNFSSVFLSPSDSCSHITTLSLSLFFLMCPNVMECQPVVLELLVSDVNKIEIASRKQPWSHVCMLNCFSHVQIFVALWTIACQAPLSMELSRQEYWNGLPSSPPEDLSDPGIKSMSPASPRLQADSLPLSHRGGPWTHQPLTINFIYHTSLFILYI